MKAWVVHLVACGLCALSTHVRHVRAQVGGAGEAKLSVEPSADGCLTQSSVSARVQRWLHGPGRAPLAFLVDGRTTPARFAVLRESEVIAERRFERWPAACNDRLDALALAIAIAIEQATGEALLSAQGTLPPPEPEPAPEPPPTQTQPKPEPPASKPPEPLQKSEPGAREERAEPAEQDEPDAAPARLRLHALGGLHAGILPSWGLLLGAGGEWVVREPLSLAFTALVAPDHKSDLGSSEARTTLVGARALACLTLEVEALALEGCAGGAGGAAFSKGRGFPKDEADTMAWLAGVARVAGRFPARSALALRLSADGVANLVRPELLVVFLDETVSASATGKPIGALASLELVLALP